ncbi:Prolyl oligopeptidase family protein [Sphingobacterium nematocida]|uniref:Prolyl oligopeptidase family protein n=1 Tax=Sphingobacterium nematocida TaxID=1513896 RepID=A0A1T5ELB3_9SPHI|nr:prolyl oligopeptidase family serine peptidase [Sphingobacterium nematocida]SKB84450.1 Prolyl oligopeptidase family protein [Sphingobacterium nematocida]
MKILFSYIVSLLVFASCPVWGQVQTTGSFEELGNKKLDASGSVVGFSSFVEGRDTFIVQDLRNRQTYSFSEIAHETILNSRFAILESRPRKKCYIVNFTLKSVDTLHNTRLIGYISETDELVFDDLERKVVVVKKLKSGKERIIQDVELYDYRQSDNTLFFLNNQGQFGVFSIKTGRLNTVAALDSTGLHFKKILLPEKDLNWYLLATHKKKLKVFKVDIEGVSEVFNRDLYDSSDNTVLDTLFYRARLVGNDRIALSVKPIIETDSTATSDAEIWYGSLKEQVPLLQYKKQAPAQLAIADLKNNLWISYYRKNSWMEFKIDEHDQVYGYEVFGNNDQTKLFPDISVYKYDYADKPGTFVGRFNGNNRSVFSFKGFSFLVYFYNNNWYYFNDKDQTRQHINLGSSGRFYDDQSEFYKFTSDALSGVPIVYSKNELLFSDTHDLWIFNTVTGKLHRDTNGLEEERRYRIDKSNYTSVTKQWSWYPVNEIKNKDGLVLKWTSDMYTTQGISLWKPGKGTETLLEDKAEYSNILRNGNFITYIKQKASQPPALYIFDLVKRQEKKIYQSNSWDEDVSHVMSEYFSWKNTQGELRGAILRFPKNYSAKQKYPAIVNIYEKKYPAQHRYISPFVINSTTINFREYTDAGYFVIEPDIFYEVGNPGKSALKSVNDVLEELATRFPIDQKHIGIIGHSFGGYQTNFIITQTDRFKAAVSSAGVSDLVNRYFVYSKEAQRPEIWRAESQQIRMAKSFFEIPENYIANSPIYHAKSIVTPLLLISGKEDYTVNWEQSMYMFNALKRLGKDVNLIFYSGEKHEILKTHNRLDVSRKIRSYFDYHLKNEKLPDWIK